MQRTIKQYALLVLKGIAMGAADVVPGVSGGTIAFISGIYEELLASIDNLNLTALKVLSTKGLKVFWKHINGNFLLSIFIGIGISVVSLAKLITYLLSNHPILVWSFFFGLIIASIILVIKKITKWSAINIIAVIIGSIIAYYVTILPPINNPNALWYIFISGAIAICAMILPGISGSFILLLLGSYQIVLSAIKDLKLSIIAVFGLGCVVGLLSFSKLLNWLFKKYHDTTVALLIGFLIGSLNKIWPWKLTISTRINSHGEKVPFLQENIIPESFSNDNVLFAIILALSGFLLITGLEKLAKK